MSPIPSTPPPPCDTPTPTLAGFTAATTSEGISFQWATRTELDSLGFNLYRATDPAGAGAAVNGTLIPSLSPGAGARYLYIDDSVSVGATYYYWLEAVETGGATHRTGPLTVLVAPPTAVSMGDCGRLVGERERASLGAGDGDSGPVERRRTVAENGFVAYLTVGRVGATLTRGIVVVTHTES